MKRLIYLSLLLCVVFLGRADVITADEAQAIASQFFAPANANGTNRAPIKLNYSRSIDDNLHIFNRGENQGFVIVSGWDGTEQPILAYSDEGAFRLDDAPENVRWIIDQYSNYIDSLKANNISGRYITANVPARAPKVVVEPLIKTKWNQYSPYNDECPEVDGVR